jgi:hypothetical protein
MKTALMLSFNQKKQDTDPNQLFPFAEHIDGSLVRSWDGTEQTLKRGVNKSEERDATRWKDFLFSRPCGICSTAFKEGQEEHKSAEIVEVSIENKESHSA